jgi:GTP-binding protein
MKPVVAIIGRPNVGKSTLFNRVSERKKAIVINLPGATRDRNYADADWMGRVFTLVDTGGFEPISDEKILVQMREQTTLAIEEADIIIFLLDGKEGLTPADEEITRILRRSGKPVLYTINKVDNPDKYTAQGEFYRLGIDRLFLLSAEHGLGVDDLMDEVVATIPPEAAVEEPEERIGIAVVGRPNVGKSSLVNKILGYERVIVNPMPGTTRDPIDTPFEYNEKKYRLIDTAGIRRKSRISLSLEKYTIVEAMKVLDRCDVALILVDPVEGITDQDVRIAGLAFEKGVICILVVNKWDLVEKDNSTTGIYVRKLQDSLKFLDFAPIVFISALTGQRVFRLFEVIEQAHEQYTKRIKTSELNTAVREILAANPPPRLQGGRAHNFSYVTQTSVKPPNFVFFVKDPRAVHFSYERYLVNQLRERFGFSMVPIRVRFRRKSRDRKS